LLIQKTDSIKILIVGKNDEKKVGFDKYMQKPFLPTDLIELIDNLENTTHDTTDDSPKHEFELSDDLSDFDELGELDDLEEDEDKNKDNNFEDDDLLEDIDMDDLGDMDELDMDDTNIGDDMDELDMDEVGEVDDKTNIDNIDEMSDEESVDAKTDKSDVVESDVDTKTDEKDDLSNDIGELDDEAGNINLDNELSKIDEEEMAKAIEANLDTKPNVPETENQTFNETQQEKTKTPQNENLSAEQTLSNMLNINVEALKNSGATITITIKFDKE